MADRAANVASIGITSTNPYKIKVIQWNLDTEIVYRRSQTSDFDCINLTVFESAGGLIRGTGYVDPADALTAIILASFVGSVGPADFDFTNGQLVLDAVSDAAGSRFGYTIGDCKLFPMSIGGQTDEAGMIEMHFEIHPKGRTVTSVHQALTWATTLT
jgi:hypothetical protein